MLNTFLSVSFLKRWFPLFWVYFFSWSVPLDHQRQIFACGSWVLNVDSADSRQRCIWCLQSCSCHPNDQIMSGSESVISPVLLKTLSAPPNKTNLLHSPPWGTSRWFIVWQCLSTLCFSTETICYHNIQQAHSGADGLSDRVSNDTTVRWIWTPCVNIIVNKQELHESRTPEIIAVVQILKMVLFLFGSMSAF